MAEEQEGGTSQAVTPIPKTKFSHTEQLFGTTAEGETEWNNSQKFRKQITQIKWQQYR